MPSSKIVLMLAQSFPPRQSSGCLRVARFTRVLPAFGWRCAVVTLAECCHPALNQGLLNEVGGGTEIYRFRCGSPANHIKALYSRSDCQLLRVLHVPLVAVDGLIRRIAVPDPGRWSISRIYKTAAEVLRQKSVDVVWITGPPFSWFALAPKLKQEFALPIVLDLRDPWTCDTLSHKGVVGRLRLALEDRMEREAFGSADAVVVNTNETLRRYEQRYPALDKSRWHVVPNAYDPGEDSMVKAESFDHTTLVHGGQTYGPRTSRHLISAIGHLKRQGVFASSGFKFISFGLPTKDEKKETVRADVENLVEFRRCCAHSDVLAAIRGADALLLLVAVGHEASVPAKLYEYLGARRPIILAGPEQSEAATIVRRTHAGVVVPINDVGALASALKSLVCGKLREYAPDAALIHRYESESVGRQLAEILTAVAK